MKDSEREQIKLTATYFNGLAIAMAAVGAIGVVFQFGLAHPEQAGDIVLYVLVALVMAVSGGLHFFARNTLKQLDADTP